MAAVTLVLTGALSMTKRKEVENLEPVCRVEPAYGTRGRTFVIQAGTLSVRLPVNKGVHENLVHPLMKREVARRIYDLLDALTTTTPMPRVVRPRKEITCHD
jgi:hypothetical protein